jgi:heterodisulfide reductase subunit B
MGARNLALAEEKGCDVLTLCNGCYGSLFDINKILKDKPAVLSKVNSYLSIIGRKYNATNSVHHFARVIYDMGLENLKPHIKKPLKGVRAAVHYGCHIIRPSKDKNIQNPDRPRFIDELVELIGIESVPYKDKMACCGAGGGVRSGVSDVALKMTMGKLENILNANVNCIINVCPFCHLQFDLGQYEIEQKFGKKFGIPVIYYTQLLGVAMGFSQEEMGLVKMHRVDTAELNQILASC